MDPIRSKQIDEALNYDRNMNAMVLNIEQKRTAILPEQSPVPFSQIDAELTRLAPCEVYLRENWLHCQGWLVLGATLIRPRLAQEPPK